MKPYIIIPAYKPDPALVSLVKELSMHGLSLIIVNDGSGLAYQTIFEDCQQIDNVTVLQHAVNLGKGQALKTAFNYFLNNAPTDCKGVVTADADGQHLVEDIINVSTELNLNPNALCLGARNFSKGVPFRSRFGNNLTRFIFRILIGHSLQDTQTGLRGIPRHFLKSLLKTNANGYDFELDMLISASKQKVKMLEVPIHTVYMDNNKSSHFNPLVDSLKIYFVFFRFLIFSIVSGLLDFLAFSLAFFVFGQVLFSETLARIFSGTCNFLLNKELVFKSKERILPEALKYATLCLVNLVFSYGLISSLVFLGANVYASKLIALTGLFIANFAIQKVLVFGKEEGYSASI
ncbi:MAG: bifunctional glycosyltransferase family 2/GtrA family protein [Proteobacteria bacterium]|nr:bifunctional glycosyltransferase family 2/GtrA family protein [Pseudomonadota bacterium]